MAYYVDTSALMKLLVSERSSAAMRRWAAAHPDGMFGSDLLRTEALRTARRLSPAAATSVRSLLDSLPLIRLESSICEIAGGLEPSDLRSLDALHLAAALTYGDELDGIVTYDDRLAAAAGGYGIAVVRPT